MRLRSGAEERGCGYRVKKARIYVQLQLQGSSFGGGKRWRRGRVTVLVRQVHVLVLQYVIQLLLHASTARVLLMRRLLILEGGGCGWRRPN